jgi:hypothetical protein
MSLPDRRPGGAARALFPAYRLAGLFAACFVVAGVMAFAAMATPAAGEAASGPAVDPRWQEQIASTVTAVVRQDDDATQRLEALRDRGRTARAALLVQLALYLERSESTEQSMGGAILLRELAYTPGEKLDAILPHLGEAGPELRHIFTEMLSTIDRPDGGEPDFTLYEQTLRARRDAPAEALILYMFEVSPDAALAGMERVFGAAGSGPAAHRPAALPEDAVTLRAILSPAPGAPPRSTSQADEDILKARAALDELARDPAWWRRLYAAAVVRAHPHLATPELVSRLTRDSHPLVRRTASGG